MPNRPDLSETYFQIAHMREVITRSGESTITCGWCRGPTRGFVLGADRQHITCEVCGGQQTVVSEGEDGERRHTIRAICPGWRSHPNAARVLELRRYTRVPTWRPK